ncbi:MAG TPA: hypothetical protein PLA68_16620 [Panacibacter sp.]|nr:hypothetical protein [Panacibacter sp.]
MKTILLIWLVIFSGLQGIQLYAQAPITDSTPAKCKWNLKDSTIFSGIAVSSPITYGKSNASPAYYDVEYKFGTGEDSCGTIDTCIANNTAALKYKVYYPINHNYNVLPLPCLILFHAGGFSDCSEYEQGNFFSTLGTELAKRGFIVFNVEYRRGRLNDKKKIYRSVQSVESNYRAIQDGRGLSAALYTKPAIIRWVTRIK